MPSGAGYLGGYGMIERSSYATPAELGPKPWALDFSAGNGWPAFPTRQRFDPTPQDVLLRWQTGDWDPGLRFWTLPFDTHLTEWLQDVDLSMPAVLAAREFAARHAQWGAGLDKRSAVEALIQDEAATGIDEKLLAWQVSAGDKSVKKATDAWLFINAELQELEDLMQDDRGRYLDEAAVQSDGIPDYFIHFLGIAIDSKPWTVQLMRCGLAIGNLVYMDYKARYQRVRPSTLCPGLVPPWGPPRHPAFPSGHSFLGHFIALLLLEIAPVAQRFGVFAKLDSPAPSGDGRQRHANIGTRPDWRAYRDARYGEDMACPLLWLAWRLAKNRERIGVHYASDSAASRRLAGGIWQAVCADVPAGSISPVAVPTLRAVLARARAEWPAPVRGPAAAGA